MIRRTPTSTLFPYTTLFRSITSGRNDEIDYLIVQLIKASRTVEHEIQRLNRIENYRKEFIGDISHELKTPIRSEEHTSELQSRPHLVCRLLLEKKNTNTNQT